MMTGVFIERLPTRRLVHRGLNNGGSLGDVGFPSTTTCPATCLSQQFQQQFQQL